MKYASVLFTWICLFSACHSSDSTQSGTGNVADTTQKKDTPVFFPVTTFIEGQIFDIRQKGLNPVRIIKKADGKNDSAWIAVETLKNEFAEFLNPVIDSVNMIRWFREKSFMDETIGLVTMTYERLPACPDTFSLREWTVYIDPETDKVKRIYLLKQTGDTIRQLTWIADKNCRLLMLDDKKTQGSPILSDVTFNWSY